MNTPYRKPWVHRHWLLVLVLSLVTMVVLSLGIGLGVKYTMMATLKDTAPYREAMARVRADARLAEALGRPIESRYVPMGNVQQMEGGLAQFVVMLRGPHGDGSVIVDAEFEDGAWHYKKLEAVADGPPRQQFDLHNESEH